MKHFFFLLPNCHNFFRNFLLRYPRAFFLAILVEVLVIFERNSCCSVSLLLCWLSLITDVLNHAITLLAGIVSSYIQGPSFRVCGRIKKYAL